MFWLKIILDNNGATAHIGMSGALYAADPGLIPDESNALFSGIWIPTFEWASLHISSRGPDGTEIRLWYVRICIYHIRSLLYHNNKHHLHSSILFGVYSLRLTREWMENHLYNTKIVILNINIHSLSILVIKH